jgi:ERCC4-related helicase
MRHVDCHGNRNALLLAMQVDLIVCWDSAPPSRLRQRSGRTGRHRPGRVVHLLMEGKEQDDYDQNKQRETRVSVSQ